MLANRLKTHDKTTCLEEIITAIPPQSASDQVPYARQTYRVIWKDRQYNTHIYLCRITYSRLSWYTSRDDDDIGASQSLLQAIVRGKEALNFGRGGDM